MHSDEFAGLAQTFHTIPTLHSAELSKVIVHCFAGAVELRNEIGRVLRVDLPGTLIFDYPTITAMSAMLTARLGPKDAEPRAEAPHR